MGTQCFPRVATGSCGSSWWRDQQMGRRNHRRFLWSVPDFSTAAPFPWLENKRHLPGFCSLRAGELFAAILVLYPRLADGSDERFRNRFALWCNPAAVADRWLFRQSRRRSVLALSRFGAGTRVARGSFSIAPLRWWYRRHRCVQHSVLSDPALDSFLEKPAQFRPFPQSQPNGRSFRRDFSPDTRRGPG